MRVNHGSVGEDSRISRGDSAQKKGNSRNSSLMKM